MFHRFIWIWNIGWKPALIDIPPFTKKRCVSTHLKHICNIPAIILFEFLDRGLVEIKCPYSFRYETVHEGLVQETKKNTTKKGTPWKNQYIIVVDVSTVPQYAVMLEAWYFVVYHVLFSAFRKMGSTLSMKNTNTKVFRGPDSEYNVSLYLLFSLLPSSFRKLQQNKHIFFFKIARVVEQQMTYLPCW